jgi:hypothetical protein
LNAHHETVDFVLPDGSASTCWERVLDTATTDEPATPVRHDGGETYPLVGRSLALFRWVEPPAR